MKHPLVSIICPCYNPGQNLERMIKSILSQDFKDFELIIIDGNSSDPKTLEILAKYKSQIIGISEKDDGIYDAMNKGIELSHGKWLYFIGADDCFYNSKVLSHTFEDTNIQNIELIIGKALFGKRECSYKLSKKIYLENTLLHQAVFYAKDIFSNGFRYNKEFRVSSDYDLNFYCYKKGFKTKYIDTLICKFSLEGISSQVHYLSYKEEIDVRKKYINSTFLCTVLSFYSIFRFCIRKILIKIL